MMPGQENRESPQSSNVTGCDLDLVIEFKPIEKDGGWEMSRVRWTEEEFRRLLLPFHIVEVGSGGWLPRSGTAQAGTRDIQFVIPAGTDLHQIRDVLMPHEFGCDWDFSLSPAEGNDGLEEENSGELTAAFRARWPFVTEVGERAIWNPPTLHPRFGSYCPPFVAWLLSNTTDDEDVALDVYVDAPPLIGFRTQKMLRDFEAAFPIRAGCNDQRCRLDDPRLPDASLSPAMTFCGAADEDADPEEIEEEDL